MAAHHSRGRGSAIPTDSQSSHDVDGCRRTSRRRALWRGVCSHGASHGARNGSSAGLKASKRRHSVHATECREHLVVCTRRFVRPNTSPKVGRREESAIFSDPSSFCNSCGCNRPRTTRDAPTVRHGVARGIRDPACTARDAPSHGVSRSGRHPRASHASRRTGRPVAWPRADGSAMTHHTQLTATHVLHRTCTATRCSLYEKTQRA